MIRPPYRGPVTLIALLSLICVVPIRVLAAGPDLENTSLINAMDLWNSVGSLQVLASTFAIIALIFAAWRYVATTALNRRLRLAQIELASLNKTLESQVLARTKQLSEEIRQREHNQTILETFFDQPQSLNLISDFDGNIIRMNQAWEQVLGHSLTELTSQRLLDLVVPDDRPNTRATFEALVQGGDIDGFENRFICADGSVATLRWSARNDPSDDLIYAFAQDITDQKSAEEALKLSACVFTATDEGIMITDADGTIMDVNQAFTDISGYDKADVVGQKATILNSGKQTPGFYASMWRALKREGVWRGEVWNRTKDGEIYPVLLTISDVTDSDGNICNYVGLFSDISKIKEYEQELKQLAQYDGLTGLPNRSLLADRLKQAMARARRHDQTIAIAFIDLDGFKAVNDTHGHAAGDQLLIEISNRLKSLLREEDTLARIGGDEFVAVVTDLKTQDDCLGTLERILDAAAT